MATILTTGVNFAKSVHDLIVAEMVAGLRAGLPHGPAGVIVNAAFQRGTNGLARFIRFDDLPETASSGFVLAEGVPPTAQLLAQSYDELQMAQFGGTVEITDLAEMQHPVGISALVDRITRQGLAIVDDVLKTAWYASAATWTIGTSAAVISKQNVLDAVAQLQAASVLRVGATAGPDGATQVGGHYVGIAHPFVIADILAGTAAGEFTDITKYTDATPLLNAEVGTAWGVRWISSAKAKFDAATTPDTYSTLIVGQQALAAGDLGTLKVNFIGPEKPDKQDPLGQKGVGGWKVYLGAKTIRQGGGVSRFAVITTKATLGSAT